MKRYSSFGFIVRRYKKKLKAILAIIHAQGMFKAIHIAPDLEARATIERVLYGLFKVENEQHRLHVQKVADKILSELKAPKESPLEERALVLFDGVLAQSFWFHQQLSGLTCTWEFKIRLFASKLGIESNVPVDSKAKKNRARVSVEHRKLSEIISDLNRKSNNRLTLKLTELSELRNSIIHCNPQAMKIWAEPVLGKDILSPIKKGNVFTMTLSGGAPLNMSDVNREEDVENQPLFSWFLEIYNSRLPKKAFEVFEQSIAQIDLLTSFSAISFDGREKVFENLFYNGHFPDDSEIDQYRQYFQMPHSIQKGNADTFFHRVKGCFNLSRTETVQSRN